MERKKKVAKADIGTVFTIVLDEKRFVYGQIVAEGYPKTYIIFDFVSEIHPPIEEIIQKKILFLTTIVDDRIENGQWLCLGKANIPISLKLPFYKVETLQGMMITNYNGILIRPINSGEENCFVERHSFSPAAVEEAISGKYGLVEWSNFYNDMFYNEQL